MAIKEDIITRSIKAMAKVLAKVLFGKTEVEYELPGEEARTDTDDLYIKIMQLMEQGQINEAETLLFDKLETGDKQIVKIALVFYNRLAEYDDAYLEEHNFSREEIMDGLKDVAAKYNLSDIAMRFAE